MLMLYAKVDCDHYETIDTALAHHFATAGFSAGQLRTSIEHGLIRK
jgi:hypothetical protein